MSFVDFPFGFFSWLPFTFQYERLPRTSLLGKNTKHIPHGKSVSWLNYEKNAYKNVTENGEEDVCQ